MSSPAPVCVANTTALRLMWVALAVGVLLRVWLGLTASGTYFDDEVLQFMEPAHEWHTGRGVDTWEQDEGVRSPLWPLWMAGVMRGLSLVGIEHGDVLWRVFRLVSALVSCVGMLAIARIAGLLYGPWVAAGAAWLVATWSPLLNLAPRVLSDPMAAGLSLWGVWLALRDERGVGRPGDSWLAGMFFSAAVLVRFQSGLVVMVVVLAWVLRRRWRALGALVLGALPLAGLAMAVDLARFGNPLHTPWAYFAINVLDNKSAQFGVAPPAFYVETVWSFFGWAAPAALLLALLGVRRASWTSAVFIVVIAAHSAIAHKELRFLAGVLPLACLFVAGGLGQLGAWVGHKRFFRPAVLAVLGVLTAESVAQARRETWGRHASSHEALAWIQRRPDVRGVLVTLGEWKTGGRFMAPVEGPVMFFERPKAHELAPVLEHPYVNYTFAVNHWGVEALEAAGLYAAGFREVHREGEWIVYSR